MSIVARESMLFIVVSTVALSGVAAVGARGANTVASNGALGLPAHTSFACMH